MQSARPRLIWLPVLLAGLLLGGPLAAGAQPEAQAGLTLMVNSALADAGDANPGDGVCETAPGSGVCTLRAAVREANARPGADTIVLPPGTYPLSLVATSFEDAALDGDLDLTDDVTLLGAGEADTIIDGNRSASKARVFHIFAGVTVTMSQLTIRNGTNEPAPGIAGGILNHGTLTLEHVTLTENDRGGLDNQGSATLDHLTYTRNTGNGANLRNSGNGTMLVRDSYIADNENNGASGGVWAGPGHLTLLNTTISHNGGPATDSGGGLVVFNGIATVINTTLSGNQATARGGGIYVGQSSASHPTTLNLHNATVVNNTADTSQGNWSGGGIYVDTSNGFTPVVNLRNTILANNWLHDIGGPASDCAGPLNSGGYNLIKTTAGCTLNGVTAGNLTGVDPELGRLAGDGPARLHVLQSDSPAIDAGHPAGCADALGARLATDQRGYARHVDGGSGAARCDIGAFEYAASAPNFVFLALIVR